MGLNAFVEKVMAGRWVAGERAEDALLLTQKFNRHGISGMINYMGERFRNREDIEDSVEAYLYLISEAKRRRLRTSVSLKSTQLGLCINRNLALENYSAIVEQARKADTFVWLDMETHEYVDDTISMYKEEINEGDVGICIQSYLRRSMKDVEQLVRMGANIRLVKGAYSESKSMAYNTWDEKTKNYYALMEYLFKNSREFMIATHDVEIIKTAIVLNKGYKRRIDFSMLNGIRNKYAIELALEGNSVHVYIPFGRRWIPYSYRRLKEPSNLRLVLRSLFESQRLD